MNGIALLLCVVAVTGAYVAFGVLVRERGVGARWLVAGTVLAAVALGALAATGRAKGVEDGPFVEGILVAAVFAGALPFLVLSSAGRYIRNAIALTVAWVVLSAGSVVLLVVVAFVVAKLVGCPPDSYECPV
jgi:hypothetical protein